MKRWAALCALALAVVGWQAGGWAAQTRGLTVVLRGEENRDAPPSGKVQLYSASYALVIGNDDYFAGWPRLSNAVEDAREIARELEARGFDVKLLENLPSAEFEDAIEEFMVIKGEDPEARLFLWYSGHGHTADGEGFLVPTDAPIPDNRRFALKAMRLRNFDGLVRLAKSKHVFAIFDSCFAGTIFSTQRSLPPPAITRITALPVRQFLTSGDAGQQVSDDGRFRKLFLRALQGEELADANKDGYLTASELGLFLSDRVTNLTEQRQTPRYGKLRSADFDRGDFVFSIASPQVAKLTPGPAPGEGAGQPTEDWFELQWWDSIKDSKNVEAYRAYLERYPEGRFAPLAKLRIDELTRRREAALPPPDTTGQGEAPQTAIPETATPQVAPLQVDPVDGDYFALKSSNVRAAPTTASRKVGTVEPGQPVEVLGKVQGQHWYLLGREGEPFGYVYGNLIGKLSVAGRPPGESEVRANPPSAGPVSQRPAGVRSFNVLPVVYRGRPLDRATEAIRRALADLPASMAISEPNRIAPEDTVVSIAITRLDIETVDNPEFQGAQIARTIFGGLGRMMTGDVASQLTIYTAHVAVTSRNRKTGETITEDGRAELTKDARQAMDWMADDTLLEAVEEATGRLVIRLSGGVPPPRTAAATQ